MGVGTAYLLLDGFAQNIHATNAWAECCGIHYFVALGSQPKYSADAELGVRGIHNLHDLWTERRSVLYLLVSASGLLRRRAVDQRLPLAWPPFGHAEHGNPGRGVHGDSSLGL